MTLLKQYGKDLTIIAAAILAVLILFVIRSAAYQDEGGKKDAKVVITTGDEVYGTYPLYEDRVVEVKTPHGQNTVTINGGSVWVSDASCRDEICIGTGKIRSPGKSIVCLPNRVSVSIVSESGKEDGGYDTVAY